MGPGGFALLIASTDLRPPRGLPARRPRPWPAACLIDSVACGPTGVPGTLHTSGAWCADGSFGASFQCPARPRRRLIDFARNSSLPHSNIEFALLELQRFWGVSKNDHDKLRAKFVWRWCCCCPWAPQPGPAAPPAPSTPVGPGCLKPLSPLRASAEPRLKLPSPLRASAEPRLKPSSPLRAPAEPRLKPSSPLRVRNGCF